MRYLPLVVALSLGALSAQEPFKASRFLPNDYHNVMHADFVQLRETGVWDELNSGMLKAVLLKFEDMIGVPFESLDRVTAVPVGADSGPLEDRPPPSDRQVVIWEGNTELAEPAEVVDDSRYVVETIGRFEVRRRAEWRDEVFLRPRPEVRIHGATELLRPILEREADAGRPCADILSLLSSRKKGLMLYFVIHVGDARMNHEVLATMFPDAEWPADDRPQYMLLRMSALGDPDDPRIEIEAVIRHPKVGPGVAVTEKAVDALIQKGLETPQLRMVAPLLKNCERGRDGSDFWLKWDLGRARTAAGNLATIMVPLFTIGTTVRAEAVPVAVPVEEPASEPAAEPAPAGKKGKGRR